MLMTAAVCDTGTSTRLAKKKMSMVPPNATDLHAAEELTEKSGFFCSMSGYQKEVYVSGRWLAVTGTPTPSLQVLWRMTNRLAYPSTVHSKANSKQTQKTNPSR
ncbi:UNVERIFIED_CONTAM: hypothetical protein PYX00_009345 [Menopon gallinae]|uniref:Uncharacterized protein n=1 Tax=Menopon gallinae TaxID=328185 RepID=A0AAW2HAY8_9NEOP